MANIYTDPVKIIELKESVLEDNNKDAQDLRSELKAQKTCLLNLMSGRPEAARLPLSSLWTSTSEVASIGASWRPTSTPM